MARAERPLSPHLDVYRWQIANTLSILHRATGVALSFGALVLAGWLISIAAGYGAYARVATWLAGPIGALLLFGWTFCFFYHLATASGTCSGTPAAALRRPRRSAVAGPS